MKFNYKNSVNQKNLKYVQINKFQIIFKKNSTMIFFLFIKTIDTLNYN